MSKAKDGPTTPETEQTNLDRRKALGRLAALAAVAAVAAAVPAASVVAGDVETPVATLYRERQALLAKGARLHDLYQQAEAQQFALRTAAAESASDDAEDAWSDVDDELDDLDRALLTTPIAAQGDIGLKARVAISLEDDRGWSLKEFRPQMRVFCEQLVAGHRLALIAIAIRSPELAPLSGA